MIVEFVRETSTGLFFLLLRIFVIVVPLMLLLQIFREFNLIDRLTGIIKRPIAWLGYKRDSIYPLLAGVLFGISYGGGVLIGESKAGRIPGNQSFLVALYLGLCHAIFEDTLIFVALGANGAVVLSTRLFLATLVIIGVSSIIGERENKREEIREPG